MGRLVMDFVLQILSWLTEEESNSIKQTQAECFANAKKKRKALGGPNVCLVKIWWTLSFMLWICWKCSCLERGESIEY